MILFFGVFALSSSAIFVKLANAPSPIIALYRMIFSTLILLPILVIKKGYIKEILQLSKVQIIYSLLSGIFLAIHYLLWFKSLNYTSVASSTVIVTLQPIFSMLGGFLIFKEKFNKKMILGCLIAIIGSIIIGFQDLKISGIALLGDFLALIAAMVITGYFFIGQHLRSSMSLVTYSSLSYFGSSLLLIAYALSRNYTLIGYSQNTWIYLLALAFISTILGQTIFNWLLKWLSTTTISMSILGEIIGTCILAYLILGEIITVTQLVGIVFIIFGLAIFITSQKNS